MFVIIWVCQNLLYNWPQPGMLLDRGICIYITSFTCTLYSWDFRSNAWQNQRFAGAYNGIKSFTLIQIDISLKESTGKMSQKISTMDCQLIYMVNSVVHNTTQLRSILYHSYSDYLFVCQSQQQNTELIINICESQHHVISDVTFL